MKVLYYFSSDGTSMWLWQKYHIIDELLHHDTEIVIFNPNDFPDVETANDVCIKKIKNEKYDVFMTVHGEKYFPDAYLDKLKKLGIPMILINFDNKLDPKRFLKISKYFDVLMLLNNDDESLYKKFKCPYVFAPYAANPFYFQDLRTDRKPGICFVGTSYGTRCKPINILTGAEVPFHLYSDEKTITDQMQIGTGMKLKDKIGSFNKMMGSRAGRKVIQSAIICKFYKQEHLNTGAGSLIKYPGVDHALMNSIYSNYDLALSVPEARNTGVLKNPVDIVRLRNFEIPMCAGLQITRYYPELASFFEEDKEIVFYRSNEELIEKVKYYSDPNHEDIINQMKTNARKRAENEHTWYRRFKMVFEQLGLDI